LDALYRFDHDSTRKQTKKCFIFFFNNHQFLMNTCPTLLLFVVWGILQWKQNIKIFYCLIFFIKFDSSMKYWDSGSAGQISWDQNSFFHEVKFMRSNFFSFFMRSKFLIIIWSPDHGIFHEIKIQKSIIRQFQSHDQFVSYKYNHEIKIQKALLGILTSW